MDPKLVLSDITVDLAASRYEDVVERRSFPGLSAEEFSQCLAMSKSLLTSKVLSKYEPAKGNPDADMAAIAKFRDVNRRVCQFDIRERCTFEWEEELLGCFRQEVRRFLYPHEESPIVLGLEQILHYGSLGPGANLSATGTDFYTKLFSSDLGVTSDGLYTAYRSWSKKSPLWGAAEANRRALGYGVTMHDASKMVTVPKNDAISRTIGVEPSLNMFYQLGLGSILRRRLLTAFGIDLSVQPEVNRELARRGSIDNNIVTIDLESASDSISLSLFEYLVPKGTACFFRMLRTSEALLPRVGKTAPERVKLGMLSMMGNGFTFPFQTMIFSCMVSAAYAFAGLTTPRTSNETWGVFGDDIACPVGIHRYVLSLLKACGFVVNASKTFVEGPFRESCGGDYFKGHNIRPVYIKSLATQEERFTVINRLVEWSANTGVYLPRTIERLQRSVGWLPVPYHAGYDSGIRVPLNLTGGLPRNRNGTLKVRMRVAKARKLKVGAYSVVVPKKEARRLYNANGLFVAALQGCWRSGGIGIRSDAKVYSTRQVVMPDWHATTTFPSGMDGWLRWIDAATWVLKPR